MIRTSTVPGDHPRHAGRGKQRYQEGIREQYRGKPDQRTDWTGGEPRKSYSAAVIDGIKRNTTICVGDSIIRKTDLRLSKGEDVVVCLPGARIEHVT